MNHWKYSVTILAVLAVLIGCRQPEAEPLANFLVRPDTAVDMGYRIQWQRSLGLPKGAQLEYVKVYPDIIVALETDNILSVLRAEDGEVIYREAVGDPGDRMLEPARSGDVIVLSADTLAYMMPITRAESPVVVELGSVINTAPVLDRNIAVYGTPTGRVLAVDLARGFSPWRYDMGASITTDPVNADGIVVVADNAGHVAAFNPLRGALLWKQDTFDTITANPAYSERQVYVASEDQALYCFDRASGEELWKYLTESPLTTSPTVVDGRVYQYVETEGLVALDIRTGDKLWTRDLFGRPLMTRNNRLVIHVPGQYVERDGQAGRLAERLLTVDAASGETIEESWLPRVQEIRADRAKNGNLYLIRRDGRIMKLAPRR